MGNGATLISQPSILVLEDNPNILDLLSEALEINGYDTVSGTSGCEGLEYLHHSDRMPDLIICDLLMPEMDGFSFIKELRRNPLWSQIPVIVVSGYHNEERHALEIGANVFIVKPFNMDKLDTTIRWLVQAG
jgi:CheY-like chemotaxis protein